MIGNRSTHSKEEGGIHDMAAQIADDCSDIAGRGQRTPGHAVFYLKLADAKELEKFEFVK